MGQVFVQGAAAKGRLFALFALEVKNVFHVMELEGIPVSNVKEMENVFHVMELEDTLVDIVMEVGAVLNVMMVGLLVENVEEMENAHALIVVALVIILKIDVDIVVDQGLCTMEESVQNVAEAVPLFWNVGNAMVAEQLIVQIAMEMVVGTVMIVEGLGYAHIVTEKVVLYVEIAKVQGNALILMG